MTDDMQDTAIYDDDDNDLMLMSPCSLSFHDDPSYLSHLIRFIPATTSTSSTFTTCIMAHLATLTSYLNATSSSSNLTTLRPDDLAWASSIRSLDQVLIWLAGVIDNESSLGGGSCSLELEEREAYVPSV